MERSRDDFCGCGGKRRPLDQLRDLIDNLERQDAIRKAKEKQDQLAALSRYVLDTHHNGSTVA